MRTWTGWMLALMILNVGSTARLARAEEHENKNTTAALAHLREKAADIKHEIELEIAEGDAEEVVEMAPELDKLLHDLSDIERELVRCRLDVIHAELAELKHEMELEKAEGDMEEVKELMPKLDALNAREEALEKELQTAQPEEADNLSLEQVNARIAEVEHEIELEKAEGDDEEIPPLMAELEKLKARQQALQGGK